MTLEEIIKAVDEGKTVNWSSRNYIVIQADAKAWGGYAVRCLSNGYMFSLRTPDMKLVEDEKDFFIYDSVFEAQSKMKH